MITFTPLSGAARASRTVPLAYLLQIDDVRILLDCGAPDWCPEDTSSAVKEEDLQERHYHWEQYCQTLKECVAANFCSVDPLVAVMHSSHFSMYSLLSL